PALTLPLHLLLGLVFGVLLLGLMHSPNFRRGWLRLGGEVGRVARVVFLEVPSRLWRHRALRTFLRSWPVQLFGWYLLQPLVVCAFLWWWLPDLFADWTRTGITFLAATFLLNTRLARAGVEAVAH